MRSNAKDLIQRAVYLLPVIALVAVGLFLASLIGKQPDDAQAIPIVSDAVDAVTGVVGGVVGGAATGAFKEILEFLFGGFQTKLTLAVAKYLTNIDAGLLRGNVANLGHYTQALAFGAAGAVATVAVFRYYLSGLSMSGNGGFEAMEGFTRLVGAVLFITAWPTMVTLAVDLVNALTVALMTGGGTPKNLQKLFSGLTLSTAFGGPLGVFAGLITVVAGIFGFLALLFMKVVVNALLVFCFVAAPLAVIFWPIPELAWLAKSLMKGFMSALIAPVIWALVFASFAAVGTNVGAAPGVLSKITTPLVALALLYLAVTLPRSLAKSAMMGASSPGGGFGGRMMSFAAGQMVAGGLREGGFTPGSGKDAVMSQTMRSQDGSRVQLSEKFNSNKPNAAQQAQQNLQSKAAAFEQAGYKPEGTVQAEQQAAMKAEGATDQEQRDEQRTAQQASRDQAQAQQRAEGKPQTPAFREREMAAAGFEGASNNPGLQTKAVSGGGAARAAASESVSKAQAALKAAGHSAPEAASVAAAAASFAPATQKQIADYASKLQGDVASGAMSTGTAAATWQDTMTNQMARPGIGDPGNETSAASFSTLAQSSPEGYLAATQGGSAPAPTGGIGGNGQGVGNGQGNGAPVFDEYPPPAPRDPDVIDWSPGGPGAQPGPHDHYVVPDVKYHSPQDAQRGPGEQPRTPPTRKNV